MSPPREYPGIAAALRELISSQHLPPGTPLPSEAELAANFGVARNTLRRALAEVERDGLVSVIPGKGRVVCAPGESSGRVAGLVTAYRQIAADLRSQIERGDYAPAGQLPSEMVLARSYGVARETARRALAELQTAGLATVVHGKGWFVARDATPGSETS
jgi:DNA-binding GntR family transcriptional regulator